MGTYARAGKREEIDRLELQAESLSEAIEREIQLIGFRRGMRVLEVGCGSGAISRKIASCVKPSDVTALDVDPTFLDAARDLAARHAIGNIRFGAGGVQNLPYSDRTFDASYCRLVLSHVDDPRKAVNELKRVTRAGGVVASSDEGGFYFRPPLPKSDNLIERLYNTLFASKEHQFRDAVTELESWFQDPTAFWMVLSILTVGRVPN